MVGRSPARIAASRLLSPGVQRPAYAGPAHVAEQEGTVQAAVRGQCRDTPGGCRRSQAPWRGNRLPQCSAYVGTDSTAASSHSLRRTGWRIVAGSSTLDPRTQSLLPASESAEPSLSRQVRSGTATRLSPEQTRLLRSLRIAVRPEGIFCFPPNAVPRGLGRVCQEALRRARTRAPLSGPLHTSGRNLQPSHRRRDRYPRDLPLERLCAPQQAPYHDADA